MGAGVSVAAGVSAGVQVDGVIHRVALQVGLTVGLLQAEVPQAHALQHLVQHAARGAATTEAAHQAGQVHVQAPLHVNGKLLLTAPELHRVARQIEARPRPGVRHAVNNGERQHKIGSRYGN
ncbi:hypothetical protein C6496_22205 [Candidatus Poribacteria bacterium]|nr:MAG: hypothetical protein C6496_22205 [Candidatus Poribacteria bacterium]